MPCHWGGHRVAGPGQSYGQAHLVPSPLPLPPPHSIPPSTGLLLQLCVWPLGHKDDLSSKRSSFVNCLLDCFGPRKLDIFWDSPSLKRVDRSFTALPRPLPGPTRPLRLTGCVGEMVFPTWAGPVDFIPSDVTKFQKSSLWSIFLYRKPCCPYMLKEISKEWEHAHSMLFCIFFKVTYGAYLCIESGRTYTLERGVASETGKKGLGSGLFVPAHSLVLPV